MVENRGKKGDGWEDEESVDRKGSQEITYMILRQPMSW